MGSIIRNVLAGGGLVIAVIGFVGFIAAAVGVWQLKAEANRRTNALAERANTAVNQADHAVVFVREVINQAEVDLKYARAHPEPEPQEPINPFVQLSARQASEKLAGSVERANGAVLTASDAVVVAEAALRLFDEDEPLKDWLGVKPEQLSQTRTELNTAGHELKRVRNVLGISKPGLQPTIEQLVAVEAAINQARSFTDQMDQAVMKTRTRVNETKQAVDMWVQRTAIGVTAVGIFAALGQFFMARYCWRVLRRKPA